MTMAKKLPLLAPSIHTFEVNGTYTDCEAKRTVFMAIQKMVSAGKYYRIPYHGSSKKGYSYKRKDGGLTITLADYPDFKKRYIRSSPSVLCFYQLFCSHYTDLAGRYGCPSYTSHKKGTRHSRFECPVFLLSAFAALLLHKSQSLISVSSRICLLYL